jgi:hypothetical protein
LRVVNYLLDVHDRTAGYHHFPEDLHPVGCCTFDGALRDDFCEFFVILDSGFVILKSLVCYAFIYPQRFTELAPELIITGADVYKAIRRGVGRKGSDRPVRIAARFRDLV